MNTSVSPDVPTVAVVILNWNGKKFLEKFLSAVIQHTPPGHSVWVADNASTDQSVEFLQENFPGVQLLKLSENYGFARGYNEALKNISADYYLLLNSDVEVTSGWLQPMISLLEKDKSIAACQPKILSWHQKNKFEFAGAAGGWIDQYGYPFCRGRIFEICEEDTGQYNDSVPVFWASGACLFIRSSVYHEMNGFDEFFFAHQEEIDLCWRIKSSGYQVYVCPESVVYHIGGGTLPKSSSRKTYLNFRNNLIMLAKNMTGTKKIPILIFRAILDQVAAVRALFQGDGGSFLAVSKAHLSFIVWLFSKKDKRFWVRSKKMNWEGFYMGNIVWEHFIKTKKTFQEIIEPDSH